MISKSDARMAAEVTSAAMHVAATIKLNMAFAVREGSMPDVVSLLEATHRRAEVYRMDAQAVVDAHSRCAVMALRVVR